MSIDVFRLGYLGYFMLLGPPVGWRMSGDRGQNLDFQHHVAPDFDPQPHASVLADLLKRNPALFPLRFVMVCPSARSFCIRWGFIQQLHAAALAGTQNPCSGEKRVRLKAPH